MKCYKSTSNFFQIIIKLHISFFPFLLPITLLFQFHGLFTMILICIYIYKFSLLSMYNVICVYIFGVDLLALNYILVYSFLEKSVSPNLSFPRLPTVLCVDLRRRWLFSVHFGMSIGVILILLMF